MGTGKSVKILLAGDCAPYSSVEQVFKHRNQEFFDNNILEELYERDFSLVNLELPLTESNDAILKTGPNLKGNSNRIEILKKAGFSAVCLANNHIYDFGEIGLKDTLDVCKNNNIQTVGAGLTLNEASKTLYVNINNVSAAIVNFAENEFCNATSLSGGANPMDLIDNTYQIKEARAKSDLVIVIVHGGHEYYHLPSPRMTKQYRYYVDCGADAVVGHHTHCIGPWEYYKTKPIVYSLGNFWFPSVTKFSGWYEGYCVRLTFLEKTSPVLEVIPYKQCSNHSNLVALITGDKREKFMCELDTLNTILKDSDELEKSWEEYIITESKNRLGNLGTLNKYLHAILRRQPMVSRILLKKKRLRTLLNYIQCESHRDLSCAILKKYTL